MSDDISNISVEPIADSQVFGDLDIASKRAIREADEFIRNYNSTIEDSTPEQQGGETDEQ